MSENSSNNGGQIMTETETKTEQPKDAADGNKKKITADELRSTILSDRRMKIIKGFMGLKGGCNGK